MKRGTLHKPHFFPPRGSWALLGRARGPPREGPACLSDTGPSWAPSAIRTGWMEPKWPRITPPLALLSDGYPTPGPRRHSVLGAGPIIRRISDGYPTVIRRLSDGYPTAIRRPSDGYPRYPMVIRSLFAAQRPPTKNQPETSYDREGPRGPKGPKHELGASGQLLFVLFEKQQAGFGVFRPASLGGQSLGRARKSSMA